MIVPLLSSLAVSSCAMLLGPAPDFRAQQSMVDSRATIASCMRAYALVNNSPRLTATEVVDAAQAACIVEIEAHDSDARRWLQSQNLTPESEAALFRRAHAEAIEDGRGLAIRALAEQRNTAPKAPVRDNSTRL